MISSVDDSMIVIVDTTKMLYWLSGSDLDRQLQGHAMISP